MIKSRSPHYKDIPYLSPSSIGIPSKFYLDIYLWNGDKSSVPSERSSRIEVQNPLGFVGNAEINISSYVNDYFIDLLPSTSNTTEIVDGLSCWVKTEVIYVIDDIEEVPEFNTTELALYGYGGGYEGRNPTTPVDGVLTSGEEVKAFKSGFFTLPFLASETESIDIKLVSDSKEVVITQDATTNPLAKVLFVDCLDFEGGTFVEVYKDNVWIKTFLLTDEFRFNPIDILYINKEGQPDVLTFFKEVEDKRTVKGGTYQRGGKQASNGHHQFVDYNKNAKMPFSVNSGFVDEDNNEMFSQLMNSETVWLLESGNLNPINVKSSSLTYKTRQNDRTINYKIDFEYSYYEINKA